MNVVECFSRGVNVAGKVFPLILVNILYSVIDFNSISRVLSFNGFHVGFKALLPEEVIDLWDLVSLPNIGGQAVYVEIAGISYSVTESTIVLMIVIGLLFTIVYGIVSFIYLRYLFEKGIGLNGVAGWNRVVDVIAYNLLFYFVVIVFVVFLVYGNPIAAVMLVSVTLVLSYFLYATPFIIVAKDKDITNALKASMSFAVTSEYFKYTLLFLIITIICSSIFTLIVVNMKIFGIVVMLVPAGIVGLWLTSSTALMVTKLFGENTLPEAASLS
ncbi:hypothetical protein J4526_07995 [Desulfurococcaceae archaeon MEX13E-LK6-19]|nr:hypothetical protein J4526_07995 [Desulfurococcaceae archaeon MEX13E-LK6-19]